MILTQIKTDQSYIWPNSPSKTQMRSPSASSKVVVAMSLLRVGLGKLKNNFLTKSLCRRLAKSSPSRFVLMCGFIVLPIWRCKWNEFSICKEKTFSLFLIEIFSSHYYFKIFLCYQIVVGYDQICILGHLSEHELLYILTLNLLF